MIEDKIKKIIAGVFDVSFEQINDDISPHSINGWDSINHLKMVIELEKQFEINFEEDEIPTLVNYKIIVATILAHLD